MLGSVRVAWSNFVELSVKEMYSVTEMGSRSVLVTALLSSTKSMVRVTELVTRLKAATKGATSPETLGQFENV